MKKIRLSLVLLILVGCVSSNPTTTTTPKTVTDTNTTWTYESAKKTKEDQATSRNRTLNLIAMDWADYTLKCDDSESFLPFFEYNGSFYPINIQYPTKAIKNKETGTVKVTFQINKSGETQNIKVLQSAGPNLDESVISSIQELNYIPGFCNKTPEIANALFTFTYRLPQNKK